MKPDKQQLINDLFPDGAGPDAGAKILRRRRYGRRAVRIFIALFAATAMSLGIGHKYLRRPLAGGLKPMMATAPAAPHALTDQELLALFPHTPVGLITLPDGRKRLIFPRPGDEQRFMTAVKKYF